MSPLMNNIFEQFILDFEQVHVDWVTFDFAHIRLIRIMFFSELGTLFAFTVT